MYMHQFLSRWAQKKSAHNAHNYNSYSSFEVRKESKPELNPELSDDAVFTLHQHDQTKESIETPYHVMAQAWETDSSIQNFRSLNEYDWDFNAPAYGCLRSSDDVAALLVSVLTPPTPRQNLEEITNDETRENMAHKDEIVALSHTTAESESQENTIAVAVSPHGGALPL